MTVFIDWAPGDPPLSAAQVAANVRYAKEIAEEVRDGGLLAEGLATLEVLSGGRQIRGVSTTGRLYPVVDLPAAPLDYRAEGRVLGLGYDVGDWFFDAATGSAYVVLIGHVASGLIATEVAAGRLARLSQAGRDAQVYEGAYSADRPYAARSVVYTGAPGPDAVFWQCFVDVPAGAPGPAAFPWGRITLSPQRELAIFVRGVAGASETLFQTPLAQGISLPAGLTGSRAILRVAPTASYTVTLRKGGAAFGTATFAAGSAAGVLAAAAGTTFVPGDVLTVTAPASPDATAADLSVSLLARLT